MNYDNYLQGQWWRDRRKTFISKTWKRCFICRARDQKFNVHHKRYTDEKGSILNREKHTDLRLLCEPCHKAIHELSLEHHLAHNTMKRRAIRDLILRPRGTPAEPRNFDGRLSS